MSLRVLRAGSYRRMRWKNGGGETAEIAVAPEGAGLEAFDWRISMARVEADGPFSAFPGIDRTLAILDGDGLALTVDGKETILDAGSAPLAFPADAATACRLLGGPVTDLNVMTRRGRARHWLRRLALGEAARLTTAEITTVLVAGDPGIGIDDGSSGVTLDRFDAVLVHGAGLALTLAGDMRATLFRIDIG
jgi:uncharacterized protein